mmetsp:Transcript_57506/g.110949  ORF Transcript_57506/g.110949 Transcript_57506/m.110949 type:complete len:295 (+) Transcript_57506:426-1310(+)
MLGRVPGGIQILGRVPGGLQIPGRVPGARQLFGRVPGVPHLLERVPDGLQILGRVPGGPHLLCRIPGGLQIHGRAPGGLQILGRVPGGPHLLCRIPGGLQIHGRVPGGLQILGRVSGSLQMFTADALLLDFSRHPTHLFQFKPALLWIQTPQDQCGMKHFGCILCCQSCRAGLTDGLDHGIVDAALHWWDSQKDSQPRYHKAHNAECGLIQPFTSICTEDLWDVLCEPDPLPRRRQLLQGHQPSFLRKTFQEAGACLCTSSRYRQAWFQKLRLHRPRKGKVGMASQKPHRHGVA